MKKNFFTIGLLSLVTSFAFARGNGEIGSVGQSTTRGSSRVQPQLFTPKAFCLGKALVNQRGFVLKQFTFESDCQEALNSQNGFNLCASEIGKTQLLNLKYGFIYDFTFRSDCIDTLSKQINGISCASNIGKHELINLRSGQILFTMTFSSECEKAKEQSASGLMCISEIGKSTLVDLYGRRIRSYTFESDCEKDREQFLRR